MADPNTAFGWGTALDTKPGAVIERGIFTDTSYVPANSLWGNSPILAALCLPEKFFLYEDDFTDKLDLTNKYAVVEDGTPAQETIDGANGILSIATDVNAEDEAYISSLREIALFASGKPMWFEALVKLTEAATDESNIIIGVSDTVGANFLLDGDAGPAASYDGAVFFKEGGGGTNVWQFETSNAGTQATLASAGTFTTATWHTIGFYFDGVATTSTITPYVDGIAGTAQNITLAGLQEMHVVFGVKAGSANAETLLVDHWRLLAVR